MSKTIRTVAAAFGAAALLASGASAASAATLSNAGGPLANGSAVSGALAGPATIAGSAGSATCLTGAFSGAVAGNGSGSSALTSPGFTLGSCTDTIPSFTVTGASLASTTAASVSAGGSVAITGATVRINVVVGGLPGVCNLVASSANGIVANGDSSLTFTDVPVSGAGGLCAQLGAQSVSARFAPLTSGGSAVTVGA